VARGYWTAAAVEHLHQRYCRIHHLHHHIRQLAAVAVSEAEDGTIVRSYPAEPGCASTTPEMHPVDALRDFEGVIKVDDLLAQIYPISYPICTTSCDGSIDHVLERHAPSSLCSRLGRLQSVRMEQTLQRSRVTSQSSFVTGPPPIAAHRKPRPRTPWSPRCARSYFTSNQRRG
jgi:hypothetical protein